MTVVLDANILLRFVDTTAALHPITVAALNTLRAQSHSLRTVPQSLYEFWVVGTRPVANNGLGLTPAECDQAIDDILAAFPVFDDRPDLFTIWRTLVATYACVGKPAHDARYVAAMNTQGITHLLTFNGIDFRRFPNITILDPHAIAASATPASTTP